MDLLAHVKHKTLYDGNHGPRTLPLEQIVLAWKVLKHEAHMARAGSEAVDLGSFPPDYSTAVVHQGHPWGHEAYHVFCTLYQ